MNWWNELLANPAITEKLPEATLETLGMVTFASFWTALVGLPLGLVLHATGKGGTRPVPVLYAALSALVNIGRAIPFIILIILLIPVTRAVVGTPLGWQAAVLPLAVGAVPFYARLVETSAREVAPGKIEAALMVGASRLRMTGGVIVREALPSLIAGFTVTVIALVGYSAMAGAVGGGGLGFLAITYGYQRFDAAVMFAAVIVILAIVFLIQFLGDRAARLVDHR
jgi:D-methionine transport system permease protein